MLIAVPITESTTDAALAAMEIALRRADLVELRLDFMEEFDIPRLLARHPERTIVTARAARQGGRWNGSEKTRVWTLKQAIRAHAGYVDVELDAAHDFTEHGDTKLILSHHDFERTPDDLRSIVLKMMCAGADIAKIACLALDQLDGVRILSLLNRPVIPTIALAMGERGLPSRVLAPKRDGYLTFAALRPDRQSAPGQPTLDQLLDLYRCRSISSATAVYGVIGKPVAHSASPAIMNSAFQAAGIDAVYLPFLVDDVCTFVTGLEELQPRGFSVTIPHKVDAVKVADHVDPLAVRVGAVNTLLRQDGSWFAANTDLQAVVTVIDQAFRSQGKTLEGSSILVLGAGGAARAAVYGLVGAGARVSIANRTHSRAVNLAGETGAAVIPLDEVTRIRFDGIANTTSVGMHPEVEATPLPPEAFHKGQVVFDAVYNPPTTRFLHEAAACGACPVSGVEMFIAQAAKQFELWTGVPAPTDVMRRALIEYLED